MSRGGVRAQTKQPGFQVESTVVYHLHHQMLNNRDGACFPVSLHRLTGLSKAIDFTLRVVSAVCSSLAARTALWLASVDMRLMPLGAYVLDSLSVAASLECLYPPLFCVTLMFHGVCLSSGL